MAAKEAWPTVVLRWLIKPSGPRRNIDGQLTRVFLKSIIKNSRIHERRLKHGKSRSIIVMVWILSVHPSTSLSILLCPKETELHTRALLCLGAESYPTLCNPMGCSPLVSPAHGDSPGRNTGVGCHALSRGSSQPRDRTRSLALQVDSYWPSDFSCSLAWVWVQSMQSNSRRMAGRRVRLRVYVPQPSLCRVHLDRLWSSIKDYSTSQGGPLHTTLSFQGLVITLPSRFQ